MSELLRDLRKYAMVSKHELDWIECRYQIGAAVDRLEAMEAIFRKIIEEAEMGTPIHSALMTCRDLAEAALNPSKAAPT